MTHPMVHEEKFPSTSLYHFFHFRPFKGDRALDHPLQPPRKKKNAIQAPILTDAILYLTQNEAALEGGTPLIRGGGSMYIIHAPVSSHAVLGRRELDLAEYESCIPQEIERGRDREKRGISWRPQPRWMV